MENQDSPSSKNMQKKSQKKLTLVKKNSGSSPADSYHTSELPKSSDSLLQDMPSGQDSAQNASSSPRQELLLPLSARSPLSPLPPPRSSSLLSSSPLLPSSSELPPSSLVLPPLPSSPPPPPQPSPQNATPLSPLQESPSTPSTATTPSTPFPPTPRPPPPLTSPPRPPPSPSRPASSLTTSPPPLQPPPLPPTTAATRGGATQDPPAKTEPGEGTGDAACKEGSVGHESTHASENGETRKSKSDQNQDFIAEESLSQIEQDPSMVNSQLRKDLQSSHEQRKKQVGELTQQLVQEQQKHYLEKEKKEADIKQLQNEKAEMAEEIEILNQGLKKAEKQHLEESQKTNRTITSLRKKVNDITEQKNSVEQELYKTKSSLRLEEKTKEEHMKEIKHLRTQVKGLKQDLKEKETHLEDLERKNDALKKDVADTKGILRDAIKKWEEEVMTLNAKREAEVTDLQEKCQADVFRLQGAMNANEDKHIAILNDMLVAGSRDGCVPVVYHALREGADPETTTSDDTGQSPLHLAAAGGHTMVVRELLRYRAPVNFLDNYGDQPIHTASRCGHKEVVRELLMHKKDLVFSRDRRGWTAALLAAAKGHIGVLEVIQQLRTDAITHSYRFNHTLLNYSTHNSQLHVSQWLLSAGVKVHHAGLASGIMSYGYWHLVLARCLMVASWIGVGGLAYLLLGLCPFRCVGKALGGWLRWMNKKSQKDEDGELKIVEGRKALKPSPRTKEKKKTTPPLRTQQPVAKAQEPYRSKIDQFKKDLQQLDKKGEQPQMKKDPAKRDEKHRNQSTPGVTKKKVMHGEDDKITRKVYTSEQQVSRIRHGLPNLGNTCYMNSVLQCLYHTQPLTRYITKPSSLQMGKMVNAYQRLCLALFSGIGIPDAVGNFKHLAGQYDSEFMGSEQKEAHDFLGCLLLWLHEELGEVSIKEEERITKSIMSHLFFGVLQSTITCSNTGRRLHCIDEPFSNVSIAITQSGKLEDALRQHFMAQKIMWDCELCGVQHECMQRSTILTQPRILILHLSRYNESEPYGKKPQVMYPASGLNLREFLTSPENGVKEYDLYALCDHKGSMDFGHYNAMCRVWDDASSWQSCDDNTVTRSSRGAALSRNTAHLLFYRSGDVETYRGVGNE